MQLIRNTRVLITGAFGYVGGRLAKELLEQKGFDVFMASSRKYQVNNSSKFYRINWDDPLQLDNICSGIDIVIHTAGMNAEDCVKDPEAAILINTLNTTRILQASIRQKVRRFIFFSTAHVYNSPLQGSFDENYCPQSLHPYATSHRAGEVSIQYAHSIKQIEGIVIRLSNSFGAPVNTEVNCWRLFVNDLCLQVIRSGQINLRSNPLQRRNFIALSEVVKAVIHLIRIPSINIGNCIFNVGSNWNPSLMEMADRIRKEFKHKGINVQINSCKNNNLENIDFPLQYSIAKLVDTGYNPSPGDFINEELQNLINFCILNEKNIVG